MRLRIAFIVLFSFSLTVLSAQRKADQMRRSDQKSFSMILLSDPQNYIKYDYNQPVFELMTAWIEDNIDSLAIKAVMCTGDLVDQNECELPPYPRFGNISSKEQWAFVSEAFERLDNKVPYIISPGNHDYGYTRSENSMTNFPEYFYADRNSCWKDCLKAVFINRNGIPSLESSAYEFISDTWGKILVITTEFAPRDEVLEWAKGLCNSEKFSDHRVIFMTHSYLNADGTRIDKEHYLISPANSGKDIWEKLISETSNIRLVICGHYANPDENFEHNVGLHIDKNKSGKNVYQMMFNAQALGGGMSGNGGDGWLRILEFMPDGITIKVKTYSPLFGFSPRTKEFAWRRDSYDQFDIILK